MTAVTDELLYEVVNGQRVEVARMGSRASILANRIARILNDFADPRNLGEAMVEVLFEIDANGSQRRPDIAFVSPARWVAEMEGVEDPAAFKTVPDLAVEILSPSNSAIEIFEKRVDYFANGVRIVWQVYPKQHRIEVFTALDVYVALSAHDSIDGGDVLPGFSMAVAELFRPRRQ